MRKWLLGVLCCSQMAWADPLLDRCRTYYEGLTSYQVRLNTSLYEGRIEGRPLEQATTTLFAHLPNQLRLESRATTRDGVVQETHVFDGTWQWVRCTREGVIDRHKLNLKKLTRKDHPFATGETVEDWGLDDGSELVGTILNLIQDPELKPTGQDVELDSVLCHVYAVAAESYGMEQSTALQLDDRGIVHGLRLTLWTDSGQELALVVRLDHFQPHPRLSAQAFTPPDAAAYPDQTLAHLQENAKQAKEAEQRDAGRLARALRGGDLKNARRLLAARPALLKYRYPKQRGVLHLAAGHPEMVRFLLKQGADANARDDHHCSAAHYSQSLAEWQVMTEEGVDLATVEQGAPPLLEVAFEKEKPDMVRFLLQRTPPPAPGRCLLLAAQSRIPEQLIPLALSLGAQPTGAVLTELLEHSGDGPAVDALVHAGADPNGMTGQPLTPLMLAVMHENVSLARHLLSLGADPNRLAGGSSPMHEASIAGEGELLQLLLVAQGDPNLAGEMGWTPLHCAAYWGRPAYCQRLIAAGADPNRPDSQGVPPRQVTQDPTILKILSP